MPPPPRTFFGCKVILGADYHTKVYNSAHFLTPGYFRPRITVEMATTESIGGYLDVEIVQSFPLEQNSKLSDRNVHKLKVYG